MEEVKAYKSLNENIYGKKEECVEQDFLFRLYELNRKYFNKENPDNTFKINWIIKRLCSYSNYRKDFLNII